MENLSLTCPIYMLAPVTLISVAFSRLGILTIVAKGYVAFTLVSAPFLIYILFLAVPWRMYKDKQDGTYPEQK